jgi:hypothetical protein
MRFLNLLTLIFVIAKLSGHLDWSWTMCFAPTIIHVAVGILLLVLWMATIIAGVVFQAATPRWKR